MRNLLLLSLLLGAGFALPRLAAAQSQTIPSGVVIRVGNPATEVDRDLKYVYMNGAQCVANVDVEFDITENFMTNQVLEVWVGPNGTDCAQGTSRDKPTNGTAPCKQVIIGNSQKPGIQPKVETSALELFGSEDEETDGGTSSTCSLEGQRWVYIMALETESRDSGSPTAKPGDFKKVGFYVDVDAPSAPSDVSSTDGESEVTVRWSVPSEIRDDVDARVRVYFDASAVSSSDSCSSETLVAGEAPPGDATFRQEVGTATSTSLSPSALGLNTIGTYVPVAVASLDAAGNVSSLSDVVCVGKIDTEGFYERCKNDDSGNCLDGLDSCSAAPWRTPGSLAGVALSLLTVMMARRRRRNV